MAASDFSAATVQTAIAAAVSTLKNDATAAARLAKVVRIAIAAELGETDVDATWDPALPADIFVEACIRLAAYHVNSQPKLGSQLLTERSISGATIRASGVRALLMPWRTPPVTVAS